MKKYSILATALFLAACGTSEDPAIGDNNAGGGNDLLIGEVMDSLGGGNAINYPAKDLTSSTTCGDVDGAEDNRVVKDDRLVTVVDYNIFDNSCNDLEFLAAYAMPESHFGGKQVLYGIRSDAEGLGEVRLQTGNWWSGAEDFITAPDKGFYISYNYEVACNGSYGPWSEREGYCKKEKRKSYKFVNADLSDYKFVYEGMSGNTDYYDIDGNRTHTDWDDHSNATQEELDLFDRMTSDEAWFGLLDQLLDAEAK